MSNKFGISKMAKSKMIRFRVTDQQYNKINSFTEKHNVQMSSWILQTLEKSINAFEDQNQASILLSNLKQRPVKLFQRAAPKIDPELLFGLGVISNNVNEIAIALHTLCDEKVGSDLNIDLLECLKILLAIQLDINSYLDQLPQVSKLKKSSRKKIDQAIEYVEQRVGL